ncbi:transposase [Streptomyces sp. NPDC002547]
MLAAELDGRAGVVVEIARDLVGECRRLTAQINHLEARLRRLAPSLLDIAGCGVISAAVVIGETAGAARSKSKEAFARFTCTAPIPVWSSNKVRVRLNGGGNGSIHHALDMIAVTQVQRGGEGADYFAKQLARGKTHGRACAISLAIWPTAHQLTPYKLVTRRPSKYPFDSYAHYGNGVNSHATPS